MLQYLVTSLLLCQCVSGLDNGLGLTPPMGFLTWQIFRCQTDCVNHPHICISENLIKEIADAMVSTGMKDAGYYYVNIDDCWLANQRDADGKLVPDPDRFPNGMKALADYVHSKGLKMGIYEDFGYETCGGYPGSEYHMETDANTFAEWGIDFLKMDGCNSDPHDMPYGYPIMGKFLNMTGRPIMYNCQWPMYMENAGLTADLNAVRENCNLWRIHGDIDDSWDSVKSIVSYVATHQDRLRSVVGPGGWNDPDMIIVGDYGLSVSQQRAQFGMWAMWAAPLLVSSDIRSLSDDAKAILLNMNVIAINQDPLGDMARCVYTTYYYNSTTIWIKQMALPTTGTVAVGYLNTWSGGDPTFFSVTFQQLGLNNTGGYTCTDAWTSQPLGKITLDQTLNFTLAVNSMELWTCVPVS